MPEHTLLVDLGLDATNADVVDQMRIMKLGREEGRYKNVFCMIRRFNDDPRELFEVPEVRAFCRRLVNLGFISYLDYSTMFTKKTPETAKKGWGAAEVYLCGEGRLRHKNELTRELLDELQRVVCGSNEKADATLGPMDPPA
jgi:hypothetical protein